MAGRVSINRYNRKEDFLLSRLASLYFIVMVANYSLKTYFKQMPNIVSMINTVMMGILVVTMFSSLIKAFKGNKGIILNSYFLFGLLLLVGCLLNANNGYSNDVIIRENAVWNLGLWIPLGCTVVAINNKEILYKELLRASYVIDIFLAFAFFTREVYTEYGQIAYNMSFGTYIILPLLLHLNEFLKRKNKTAGVIMLFELFALLVYGNRGGLLSIAFFLLSYYVLSNRSTRAKSIFIVIGFVMILFVSIFGELLMSEANTILSAHGIQSRTLDLFFSGDISLSTERDELRIVTIEMIKESPFFGWGFGGEYYEIARRFSSISGGVNSSFNPHNGILQNFVEFGVILGFIASFLIVKPLFGVKKIPNSDYKDLLIIFASYAIIPKLVSAAGFFIHPEVAVFLYLYYFKKRSKKVIIS